MKNLTNTLLLVTLTGLMTACAHHNNVRPSDDGIHFVKLSAATQDKGTEEALNQANYYCEKQEKAAYITNESIEYHGSMPEKEYLQKRNIADAVETAGVVLWAVGQSAVDDVGTAIALGGGVAKDAMGTPYFVDVTFGCK